jgi:UDP-N-acetylmuramoyl-L-alanyl-D-glutamate--2,6-diaminopimelate ligase
MNNHNLPAISVDALFSEMPFERTIVGNDVNAVTGITQDSRDVAAGDLFCCVRGEKSDGHKFIGDVIAKGATSILLDGEIPSGFDDVCFIQVDNVRECLGHVASAVFGHPSKDMTMVGITGTNGKTSSVAIVASILEANGSRVGTMGTLTGVRTTLEPIELQATLKEMLNAGVDSVVMEVSSHALDQGRVLGIMFDVAVLTNITRDHLDYHHTEERYFAAKAKLFTPELSRVGIVNIDDTRGRLLFDVGAIPMVPYSMSDADDIELAIDHVSFQWQGIAITVPMGGRFTLLNTLGALTVAARLGVSDQAMKAGCAALLPIPGRFQTLHSNDGVHVVVDYAHTPDGLREVLDSVRPLTSGRVIVVFGCGGERDTGKRSMMGAIASETADVVFVTSDNPRGESPLEIISEVVAGTVAGTARVEAIVDRGVAIASAISEAGHGDIVVIAGKGHELTQEVAGVHIPFSDFEIAKSALEQRKDGAP